jgi:hypothetical protein
VADAVAAKLKPLYSMTRPAAGSQMLPQLSPVVDEWSSRALWESSRAFRIGIRLSV